jgi:hypothetical protein
VKPRVLGRFALTLLIGPREIPHSADSVRNDGMGIAKKKRPPMASGPVLTGRKTGWPIPSLRQGRRKFGHYTCAEWVLIADGWRLLAGG